MLRADPVVAVAVAQLDQRDRVGVVVTGDAGAFASVADSGLDRIPMPTASSAVSIENEWSCSLWETNAWQGSVTPDYDIHCPSATNPQGTVDITGLESGVLYVCYGTYNTDTDIDVTMSGGTGGSVSLVDAGALTCDHKELPHLFLENRSRPSSCQ